MPAGSQSLNREGANMTRIIDGTWFVVCGLSLIAIWVAFAIARESRRLITS